MENLPPPGRDIDCSLKAIGLAGLRVLAFVAKELEQEVYEQKMLQPRYIEHRIIPAAQLGNRKNLPGTVLGSTWTQRVLDILPR